MLLALALILGAAQTAPKLVLTSTTQTLDNGLTVVVSPDHSVPGVAVDLWYRVGSRNEEVGRTGFAHLFEHLMFMGARHVPYPRFDTLMEAAGGVNNASTSDDRTNYWEVGPSNLLETFFWMEADRMATLGATMTQQKLEAQRLIVLNERRQSYENRPYGMADYVVAEALYPKGHPYSWDTIGSPADLNAATLGDVTGFFARWYVPNDATLVVVGDVEPAAVFALAKKYFGFLPKKALPATPNPAPVVLATEKRISLTDKVELPKLIVIWPSPQSFAPGDAECDLLASLMGRGKASRLYERLVHHDQIATQVQAVQASADLGSQLRIEVLAAPGHTTAEVQAALDSELKKLLAEGPTAAEIDSARERIVSDYARGLEGLQPRSEKLADYAVHFGDANSLERDLARYAQATPASVLAVAKQVLVPGRLVIDVQPEAAGIIGGAK
jgi:zinc protease